MLSWVHLIAAKNAVRGMHVQNSVVHMWIASSGVHVNNSAIKLSHVYVGSVTKKKISQSTYPKDGIMVLGNVSAWNVLQLYQRRVEEE